MHIMISTVCPQFVFPSAFCMEPEKGAFSLAAPPFLCMCVCVTFSFCNYDFQLNRWSTHWVSLNLHVTGLGKIPSVLAVISSLVHVFLQ